MKTGSGRLVNICWSDPVRNIKIDVARQSIFRSSLRPFLKRLLHRLCWACIFQNLQYNKLLLREEHFRIRSVEETCGAKLKPGGDSEDGSETNDESLWNVNWLGKRCLEGFRGLKRCQLITWKEMSRVGRKRRRIELRYGITWYISRCKTTIISLRVFYHGIPSESTTLFILGGGGRDVELSELSDKRSYEKCWCSRMYFIMISAYFQKTSESRFEEVNLRLHATDPIMNHHFIDSSLSSSILV